MSTFLRRLADWLEDHQPTAGRVHSSELEGLQHRKRDVIYAALGPIAVLVDLPKRFERPPAPKSQVQFIWNSTSTSEQRDKS